MYVPVDCELDATEEAPPCEDAAAEEACADEACAGEEAAADEACAGEEAAADEYATAEEAAAALEGWAATEELGVKENSNVEVESTGASSVPVEVVV